MSQALHFAFHNQVWSPLASNYSSSQAWDRPQQVFVKRRESSPQSEMVRPEHSLLLFVLATHQVLEVWNLQSPFKWSVESHEFKSPVTLKTPLLSSSLAGVMGSRGVHINSQIVQSNGLASQPPPFHCPLPVHTSLPPWIQTRPKNGAQSRETEALELSDFTDLASLLWWLWHHACPPWTCSSWGPTGMTAQSHHICTAVCAHSLPAGPTQPILAIRGSLLVWN